MERKEKKLPTEMMDVHHQVPCRQLRQPGSVPFPPRRTRYCLDRRVYNTDTSTVGRTGAAARAECVRRNWQQRSAARPTHARTHTRNTSID